MNTRSKYLLLALFALALAACANPQAPFRPAAPGRIRIRKRQCRPGNGPLHNRIQDISGTMLLYVMQHKDLPATLDDLRPLAGPDLKFTCPNTGQPYIYVRTGLSVPGQERLLVLYDALPSPGGWRWGLVASPPEGNRPFTLLVVRLTDQVLNAYLQSAPAAK